MTAKLDIGHNETEGPYRILVKKANTAQWLEGRKRGVGASESAAVLGLTGWGSAVTVFKDKTNPATVDISSDLMQLGHLAEPVVIEFMSMHPERYRFIGDIHPSEGLLQSTVWPWLLGTLDRRVLTPQGIYVPLEIKSVNDHSATEWQENHHAAEPDAFGITEDRGSRFIVPVKYQVQVQQQMAVTGAPFAYVAVWLGKDRVEVIRVDRDDDFIETFLVGIVGKFWTENVLRGVTPEPILGDDLWERFVGIRGAQIEATEDIADDVFLWRTDGVARSEADKARKERAHRIALFMGNATEMIHPVTKEVMHTLLPQNGRAGIDDKKLEREFPEAFEACSTRGNPFRVHRATKYTFPDDADATL